MSQDLASTEPAPGAPSVPDRAQAWLRRVPTLLHRTSLRARLIAVTLCLLVVALALSSSVMGYLMRRELIARVDDNLRRSSTSVANQALNQLLANRETIRLPSVYAVVIFPQSGTGAIKIPATDVDAVPALSAMTLADPRVDNGEAFTLGTAGSDLLWRGVARALDDGTAVVVVAQPLKDVSTTLKRFALLAALISLATLAAFALVGWLAVRRAFRPLTEIENTARAISAGDLSRRIPTTDAPEEVASLSTSLNAMLTHVEESFAVREASEERMRQFVADASHELRTPLATVRGYAELYRQGAVPEQALPSTIGRIEGEASRMAHLVDDLLLLARLDEERPLEKTPFDVTVVAAEAVQAARVRDPARHITLTGLSGALTPLELQGEEAGMHQVLGNLLTNAIRHTPAGTPIDVAVGRSASGVVIEVRDHGHGIDEAAKSRIFERFYRVDSARTRASGGTGLGLAIVAAIVARHGGRVGIATTPGGGATFIVELPAPTYSGNSQA